MKSRQSALLLALLVTGSAMTVANAASSDAQLIAKLQAENKKLRAELAGQKHPKSARVESGKAAPVVSAANPVSIASGDISASVGIKSFTNIGLNDDNDSVIGHNGSYGKLDGRYLIPLTAMTALQIDASSEAALNMLSAEKSASFMGASQIGAHFLVRDGSSYQVGIFGGATMANIHDDGGELWHGGIVGVEGQLYFNNVTLWSQVGYAGFVEGLEYSQFHDDIYTPVQLRGGLRYFVSPDTKIGLSAGYETGTLINSNSSTSTKRSNYTWGDDIERLVHLGTVPASLFVKYTGTYMPSAGLDSSGTVNYNKQTSQSVMAGVSFKLGTTSLIEQDRHGANTDIDIGRIPMIDTSYSSIPTP